LKRRGNQENNTLIFYDNDKHETKKNDKAMTPEHQQQQAEQGAATNGRTVHQNQPLGFGTRHLVNLLRIIGLIDALTLLIVAAIVVGSPPPAPGQENVFLLCAMNVPHSFAISFIVFMRRSDPLQRWMVLFFLTLTAMSLSVDVACLFARVHLFYKCSEAAAPSPRHEHLMLSMTMMLLTAFWTSCSAGYCAVTTLIYSLFYSYAPQNRPKAKAA
jgi:hypothetical protein